MIRRRVLQGALGVLVGTVAAARAQQRWSKRESEYQDSPKDEQTCGQCSRFRPPAACAVVDGEISRDGWCKFFDMVD